MTRSIFAFAIAYALVGGFAARVAHADDKIAFVDLQRALEETKDGKAAKNRSSRTSIRSRRSSTPSRKSSRR